MTNKNSTNPIYQNLDLKTKRILTSKFFKEHNITFESIDKKLLQSVDLILKQGITFERKQALQDMIVSDCFLVSNLEERFEMFCGSICPSKEWYQLRFGDELGDTKYNSVCTNRGNGNTLEGQIKKYGKVVGTKRFNNSSNKKAHTLENFIAKHGEEKGQEMFDATMAKKGQSLDKFVIKYGKEDGTKRFNLWIESCKGSKENFINRHGKELGEQKWVEFKEKSKSTLPNFIKRHGEKIGKEKYKQYCNRSANTKENFIRVHGDKLGLEKWNKYINNANTFRASTESLAIFTPLTEKLIEMGLSFDEIFYGVEDSFEYKIEYNENKYYSFDFTIPHLNIIIEYNGSHVHPSKEKLSKSDWKKWRSPWTKETADSKYKFDSDKITYAEKSGFDCIVIWDYDNKLESIEKCLKLIEERI